MLKQTPELSLSMDKTPQVKQILTVKPLRRDYFSLLFANVALTQRIDVVLDNSPPRSVYTSAHMHV